jgi:uncharacterized membrane protein (DUF485 family)
MSKSEPEQALDQLAHDRARVAAWLTAVMIVLYFGFISLIAFNKPLLALPVAPGLTLGILLGVLVIVGSWLLTWIYVRWANTHYDSAVDRLNQ